MVDLLVELRNYFRDKGDEITVYEEDVLERLENLVGLAKDLRMETFEQAWARKEAEGYSYGPDALENVRFGWELAKGMR